MSTESRGARGSDSSAGRGGTQRTGTLPTVDEKSSVAQPPAATTTATPNATVENPGMRKLLDTLSALGMSASGLDISYAEESVFHPSGSYMNRQIRVSSGGKTEQFDAALTEKNPLVTAYEMQRYFGVTPTFSGTSGTVHNG